MKEQTAAANSAKYRSSFPRLGIESVIESSRSVCSLRRPDRRNFASLLRPPASGDRRRWHLRASGKYRTKRRAPAYFGRSVSVGRGLQVDRSEEHTSELQ